MEQRFLKIDMNSPVHSNFVGNAAVYHGYAGMPDDADRVYTEEQCILEADRAAEIGVKIARTMYKWYGSYDKQTDTWDFNTPKMNVFEAWCKRLYDRGIDIALQAGWCCPGDINATSWNSGCPYAVEGDYNASLKNYVSWMVQTVKYLVIEKGLTNVKYLIMFTEPQHPAGTLSDGCDNCYDAWCDAVEALHNGFVEANIRDLVKLVGPNEGSTTVSDMVEKVAYRVKDYIDIYSSHNYMQAWVSEDMGIEDGAAIITFLIAGGRIQQIVDLKPNTDYEVTLTMRGTSTNDLTISGNVVFGAFTAENPEDNFNLCTAGGEPTNRLNKTSLKMLDAVYITDDWADYTHTFNSGDATEASIGIFSDIKQPEMGVYLKAVSLRERGTDTELMRDGEFKDEDKIIRANDTDEKTSWRYAACSHSASNPYYDWHRWVKTALKFLPEGKEFWFDEYNVCGIDFDCHTTPMFGSRLAQAMLALMTSGAQSSVMWTLFDQQWPNNHSSHGDAFHDGEHRWGVMPTLFRSNIPYPAYYAAGLMFRYMGGSEGTRVFKSVGGDPVFAALTISPTGEIGLAVANTFDGEREFTLSLSNTLGGVRLQKRLYDPATIVPDESAKQLPVLKEVTVEDSLTDTLPPFAIAVYSNIK